MFTLLLFRSKYYWYKPSQVPAPPFDCTNSTESQHINNSPQEMQVLKNTPTTSLLKQSVLATTVITQQTFTISIKVNNTNLTKWCEICSKLTINTLKRRHWRHCEYLTSISNLCIAGFEHAFIYWVPLAVCANPLNAYANLLTTRCSLVEVVSP